MGRARDPRATFRLFAHSCVTQMNRHSSQDTRQDPPLASVPEQNPGSHPPPWGWGWSGDGERLHKLFVHVWLTITPTSVPGNLAQSLPASGRW